MQINKLFATKEGNNFFMEQSAEYNFKTRHMLSLYYCQTSMLQRFFSSDFFWKVRSNLFYCNELPPNVVTTKSTMWLNIFMWQIFAQHYCGSGTNIQKYINTNTCILWKKKFENTYTQHIWV